MLTSWPLVGRDGELALIDELLSAEAPTSVVVAGPSGVGKTRLVSEALHRAERRGLACDRVVGSRAASSIPLGALAPLLPVGDDPPASRLSLLRWAAAAIEARGAGGPLVLAVDDAHLLDDASATLVHQLASSGAVALVATVTSGEPVPDSIALLWKDAVAERLELGLLERFDVTTLVELALGGDADAALLRHLWTVSGGNPLYLRELVVGGVESGSIRREGRVWRLAEALGAPARLVELIDARLAGLDDKEQEVVDLLAVGEAVGLATLEIAVGLEPIESLERRGVVTVASDQRRRPVRLAHPLYDEARRARMPAARARALERTLAEMIERAGSARRTDLLRVAILRLEADGTAPPDLLVQAASQAFAVYDLDLTERLARAARDAGAGVPTLLLLAEVLRWKGRSDDAEALLAGIDPRTLANDEERTLVALVRSESLFRGLDRYDEALAVLGDTMAAVTDPAWRAELVAEVAVVELFAGNLEPALALAEEACGPPGRGQVLAAAAAAQALALAGRIDDALRVAQAGFAGASGIGRQRFSVEAPSFAVYRGLALCEAGRLDEAESAARLGYEWSLDVGISVRRAWFGMLLGKVLLARGLLEQASRLFEEAALLFRDIHDGASREWCLAGVAMAAAAQGDATAARVALHAVGDFPSLHGRLLKTEIGRARAAAAAADGDLERAVRLVVDLAAEARQRGLATLEAAALHDAVRWGRAEEVTARLAELAEVVEGPISRIRADHAAALAARDGVALDCVADRFESTGALLLAAEAAAHAAAAHEAAGARREQQCSAGRSLELGARCEGARTPALRARRLPAGLASLTAREREIARLAAAGHANRAIAEKLFLSVRTVENHLQRAYAKLGVRGRIALAMFFDDRKE